MNCKRIYCREQQTKNNNKKKQKKTNVAHLFAHEQIVSSISISDEVVYLI